MDAAIDERAGAGNDIVRIIPHRESQAKMFEVQAV